MMLADRALRWGKTEDNSHAYVLALARLAALMNLVHGWSSQGGPIMEKRIARFRRQVEAYFGGPPGRGARYPLAFRTSAVEVASAWLASGERLGRVATELGVGALTLRRWLEAAPGASGRRLRPVEVVSNEEVPSGEARGTLPGLGATPIVTATRYLPSGPIDSLTLGNGIVETRAHDQRYHPVRIAAGPAAGTNALDWQFTTDPVGNITSITDAVTPANSRTYGYLDHQYFLTQGDGPWGMRAWTYDAIGNRLTETRDTTTNTYAYVPNAAGSHSPTLASITLGAGGTEIFQFDAAGNQVQDASPTSTLDSTFDDASRQAATSDSTFQIANRYDGRGFLEHSERTYPGALFADGFEAGNTTCWSTTIGGPTTGTCPTNPQSINPTYTSDGLLQHLSRGFTGEEQKWVLYHAGRPVAIVRQTGTAPASVTFLTTDHLGTPVLAMDGAGLEVWEGGFEPFGADYANAESAGVFLRFPGQWVDGLIEEGGFYNVHRWYKAKRGTYSRADPLGLPAVRKSSEGTRTRLGDGFNLYPYSAQNPITKLDPLGLAVTTKGCSARDDSRIQIAAAKADAASQTCLACADRTPFSNTIRSQGTSNEITFECAPWKTDPVTKDEICGSAWPPGTRQVQLTPNGLGEVSGCGCLEASILHEVLHLLGKKHDAPGGRFSAVQKCFNCAS